MEKTLKFNPFERIPAKDILRHRYFKEIRNKKYEKVQVDMTDWITDSVGY